MARSVAKHGATIAEVVDHIRAHIGRIEKMEKMMTDIKFQMAVEKKFNSKREAPNSVASVVAEALFTMGVTHSPHSRICPASRHYFICSLPKVGTSHAKPSP